MFFGSRLNRLATSIRRGISKYSVGSDNPGLVFDFIDNFYQKDKNQTVNFNGAITHARSGNAVMTDGYGPELVVNGGFDSDSDWTKGTGWSIADGKAVSVGHTGHSLITQPYSFISGKTYEVTYTITNYGSGTFAVQFTGSGTTTGTNRSANGTYTEILTVVANHTAFGIRSNDGNGIGSIDNVSVREMPVLKWAPHNLYQYSEQFDNSYWQSNLITVSANSIVAPNGTTTADKLIANVVNTSHYIGNAISYPVASETYELCVYAKPAGYNFIKLFGANSSTSEAWFDISNGTKGTTGGTGFVSSSITDVGNGWYRCALKFINPDATARNTGYYVVNADNVQSFAGDGTSGIHVWGAHLYKADLGGMVDNPDRGDSYVPTAAVASGDSIVVDGGFDDHTNWTLGTGWSISGSKLVGSNVGGTAYAQQTLNTTSGAYVVTFDVTDYTSGNLDVFLGGATSAVVPITGAGSYSVVITGVGTNTATTVRLSAGNANFTGSIDNLVVKKSLVDPSAARYLPRVGHHVYNGSAWVNEGVLAESESRTNLIEYSDASSGWSASAGTLTANSGVSPDGSENASSFVEDNNSANHQIVEAGISGLLANVDNTFSAYVKTLSGSRYAQLRIYGVGTDKGWASFDLSSGVLSGSGGTALKQSTIQNIGNGWYRVSITTNHTSTYGVSIVLADSGATEAPSYTGDGTSGIYFYGIQVEQASTPSSYIPTSGSSVTRAAETFTIPSANLPWPTPQYIGSELVTNGDFSTDSDWTKNAGWSIASGVATYTNTGSNSEIVQTISGLTVGNVYQISVNIISNGSSIRLRAASPSAVISPSNITGTGEATLVFTAAGTNESIRVRANAGGDVTIDNISVREINPLSVSIAMDGRITYADENASQTVSFANWLANSTNYIQLLLATTSTDNRFWTRQTQSGVVDQVLGSNTFAPDINVPFDIASRHGSTFINGAVDGVALTANTTPTALPDLSATDLNLAYDYMGTLATFRVWDRDIGDTGLVEATSPSLEPSLSLTFEGVGTNSFVVNDWS